MLEQFSIDLCKTKTKVSTLALHNPKAINITVCQSILEVITCCCPKARENMSERLFMIGYSFNSDWMKNWGESFKPVV